MKKKIFKNKLEEIKLEDFAKNFYEVYQDLISSKKTNWESLDNKSKKIITIACGKTLNEFYKTNFIIPEIKPTENNNSLNKDIGFKSIKDFFDSFVGLTILSYDNYNSNILENEVNNKLFPGIIESNSIKDDSLYVNVSDLNGINKSIIVLKPTANGKFIEKSTDEDIEENAIFRINLYGGVSIEYCDDNVENKAYLIDNQKENTWI